MVDQGASAKKGYGDLGHNGGRSVPRVQSRVSSQQWMKLGEKRRAAVAGVTEGDGKKHAVEGGEGNDIVSDPREAMVISVIDELLDRIDELEVKMNGLRSYPE